MQNITIEELKNSVTIPESWRRLGYPDAPEKDGLYSAPYREDRKPSFSIRYNGRHWKDFATGHGGDVVDFIKEAMGIDSAGAIRVLKEWGGFSNQAPARSTSAGGAREADEEAGTGTAIAFPLLYLGTEEHYRTLAEQRGISPVAVYTATRLHVLRFGEVCGHFSWLLADSAKKVAEARRMDGKPYPAVTDARGRVVLGERKAHTLRGSTKSWPAGTAVLRRNPHYKAVALVEGGPDFLAALHFILEADRPDILPVAMLGRGTGARMDAEALALLSGRRVRIYPHDDADGGGMNSAQTWAAQLHASGCTVDFFSFCGLTRRDGHPVKDLNDAVLIDAAQQDQLSDLLP